MHEVDVGRLRQRKGASLHVQRRVGENVQLASETEVLLVVGDKLQMITEVAVHVYRVLDVESVERYGGLADRTRKLILQQTHVVVVDVHVGEHLAQHGVENLSRLQHVVHTFRALALDDVLLYTRVLSINVLCNGLVVRNGQDKLAVVGRCLDLVAYVSLVLELARIEIGWLYVVQRERNLLILVILIIVVIVQMRALLGCDYALH